MDSNPATHFLTSVVLWNNWGRIHDPFILASSMSPKLVSQGWYSLAASLRWAITSFDHINITFHMLKQLVSRRKQLFWISPFTSWKISWVESYPEGTLPIVPRKNYWYLLNGANPHNNYITSFLTSFGYNKLLSALFLSKLCVFFSFLSILFALIIDLHELSVVTISQTQCCAVSQRNFLSQKKLICYFKI